MRQRTTRCAAAMGTCLALVAAGANAEQATAITASPLANLVEPIERSAPAEVVSLKRAQVAARLAAPLEAIRVDVGDAVDAGAVVAELECVDARNRLERAEARLAELKARRKLARTRLERTRRLRDQNAVSADELDEARSEYDAVAANLRAQNAQVAAAQRDVDRCTVEAPFAGVVARRPGQPGTYVQPGTTVVEVIDADAIVLSARLRQVEVATLRSAGKARFSAEGKAYPVRVRRVVPRVDPVTGTREVRLEFTDGRPLPGAAGRVRWQAAERAIPPEMVVRRDGQLGVMQLIDGRARFNPLPKAIEGRPVPTELAGDTRVIVQGRYAVADGDPVEVRE